MGRTVAELRASLTYAEWVEWQAFFTLEPWGCSIDDQRSALVAATIANANRAPDRPPHPLSDFMPDRTPRFASAPVEPEKELTPDQLADWWDANFFGIPPEAKD